MWGLEVNESQPCFYRENVTIYIFNSDCFTYDIIISDIPHTIWVLISLRSVNNYLWWSEHHKSLFFHLTHRVKELSLKIKRTSLKSFRHLKHLVYSLPNNSSSVNYRNIDLLILRNDFFDKLNHILRFRFFTGIGRRQKPLLEDKKLRKKQLKEEFIWINF